MLLKLLLFSTLAIFSFGYTHAEKKSDFVEHPYTDTTGEKKDSVNAPLDPKEGFKNLYINTDEEGDFTLAQLNPLAISFVEDYIDKHGKKMEEMKVSGKPYFDMMDDILSQHGLPKELKYLALIESYLKTNARSWAGAVGPWQFMATTARNMGLRVNGKVDERKDVYKSTHAASRYLTSLYSLYGDWLLVIAAYNGGPGTVNSAIKRSGSRDFWQLQRFLPLESRNHVKKFIATHYIMEGEGGLTTLTKNETGSAILSKPAVALTAEELTGSKLQSITGRYNSTVMAKHLAMDIESFHKFNPGFDKIIATNGKYELRLPNQKMDIFLSKKFDILGESVQLLLNPDAVSKQ